MTDEPDSTIEIQMSDSQLDFFVRNQVAVHVVQHWDTSEPHRTAGMLVVSRRLLEDPGFDLAAWAVLATERVRRPWRYPDPPAIPKIEPFPRLSRFLRRGRAARRVNLSATLVAER